MSETTFTISEAPITSNGIVPPPFEFDGYRFNRPWDSHGFLMLMSGLYLAKRARAGDADAAAVLTALKVTLEALNGRTYWPLEADAPVLAE